MEQTNNDPHTSPESGALYALGALAPDEAAAFESRLLAGEVDARELEDHLQVMTALCEEIASVMPAPRRTLKDAVMAAVTPQAEEQPPAETMPRQIFVLAGEGEWQQAAPGISLKILHADPHGERTTVLVRIDPGAAYPPHRHRGVEECLVLEGDLHVDGTVLTAGDFTASFHDKIHIDTHSRQGCLLLISSPLNDEFLGHEGATPAS